MFQHLHQASIIQAAGNKPKQIQEFFGRVNSKTEACSLARMISPEGWQEPGQRPEFSEYTIVLKGVVVVEDEAGKGYEIKANEALHVPAGDWVRYSTPYPGGAEYIALCLPAFSPDLVHRDSDTQHRA